MDEAPTTKLIWLYLLPKGRVAYSTRRLAAALNLSQRVATVGLKRLRVLGLLEDLGERRERVRPVYQAVEPGGRAVRRTGDGN